MPYLAAGFPIDVAKLIESRMLLTANSGGGKSWALRRILEQTHGQVQQIVIDPEGEFHTLRERYDYILAGKGGDCPTDIRSAALLCRKLLELGVSAVLDIYELKQHERVLFVRRFLEELVNAPKDLWHPAIVVIDEAHIFASENGNTESAQAVVDLMTRGRKRGYCGILATQRPAALNKNASAQCNNKLVGRFSQDIDVKRAADDLGFYSRPDQLKLRELKPGEFFAVGPAICDTVQRIKIGNVQTTHPQAGERSIALAAPSSKVKAVLAKLTDLPKQAEEEARTIEDLRKENQTLKRQLAQRPKEVDEAAIRAAGFQTGYEAGLANVNAGFRDVMANLAGKALFGTPQRSQASVKPEPKPVISRLVAVQPRAATMAAGSGDLAKATRAILNVLAQFPDGATKTKTALIAGYSSSGGGFNNSLSSLRTKGFIVGSDPLRITDTGADALGNLDPLPQGRELLDYWLRHPSLGKAERAILSALYDKSPRTKQDLAAAAGYEATGGGFNNALSRLRALDLISGSQELQIAEDLQ